MNKMNIPAPFRMALPTPPLPPAAPVPSPPPPPPPVPSASKRSSEDLSESESEMESSEEVMSNCLLDFTETFTVLLEFYRTMVLVSAVWFLN